MLSKIKTWSNIKITDPKYKKEKLMRFLDIASTYRRTSSILSKKLKITKPDYDPKVHEVMPGVDNRLIDNYKEVIDIFYNLKEYSKKNEKDSYEYFEKKKKYEEDKFLLNSGYSIIYAKSYKNSLDCEDPIITLYAENWNKLKKYYNQNEKNLKFGEDISLQVILSGGISNFTLRKCTHLNVSKEYNQYFIDKRKRLRLNDKGEVNNEY